CTRGEGGWRSGWRFDYW
nr:immunoglobulin heavy chain junction region [Macaca mulatta]